MANEQNQPDQTQQNTFVYLMTNPDGSFKTDRIIISKSQSYPKIFTFKVIGSNLVNSFMSIFDLDYSKSVESNKVSQIIGAVSIFKLTPALYSKISSNSDLSDMNVVLDSSKQAYGIIKRFLLTNPENLTNTFNEVIAYVDTYVKTQLSKYDITDDCFMTDINVAMFLMLSGKQKMYQPGVADFIVKQAGNAIPQSQLRQPIVVPEKKGLFSFLHKEQSQPQAGKITPAKPQKSKKIKEDNDIDLEISSLEDKVGKTEKTGFFGMIWKKWKEDAWESPETHSKRVEEINKEINEKLDLEKKKLDLIERRQKIKREIANKNNTPEEKSDNEDSSQQSEESDEEQD